MTISCFSREKKIFVTIQVALLWVAGDVHALKIIQKDFLALYYRQPPFADWWKIILYDGELLFKYSVLNFQPLGVTIELNSTFNQETDSVGNWTPVS